MTQSPSSFINSPSTGVQLFGKVWAGCVAAAGDNVTATVRAWTGPNGTGSLVAVTNLECWVWDFQANAQVGHFGPGNFNTVNASHTASGGEAGHYFYVAGKFTAGSPGSLEFFVTYSSSAAFIPTTPSFTPSVGAPGTAVTITGSRFTDATGVWFNGTGDGTFVVNSDTSITAHVPAGATKGKIQVGNPAGNALSVGDFTPGQIYFGPTATNQPVAIWYGPGGAPVKVVGVWVKDGVGVKRIW